MDITLNFHPASEPPKQEGEYMTIINLKNGYRYWRVLEWSVKHQAWNVYADNLSSRLEAEYWAELPEVPK